MRFLGHLSKSWLVHAIFKKKEKKKTSAWNKWECCEMTEILLNSLDMFSAEDVRNSFLIFTCYLTQHLLLRVLSLTYNKILKMRKKH